MSAFKKVLFIDDDFITVNICQRMMGLVHFADEFVPCDDGQQAKDYLMSHMNDLPNIIFVDLHMTVMNGWEFLEWFENWLTNENLNIPIYVLSSSLSREDFDRAYVFKKVSGYIIKPMTAEHLNEAIEKFGTKS